MTVAKFAVKILVKTPATVAVIAPAFFDDATQIELILYVAVLPGHNTTTAKVASIFTRVFMANFSNASSINISFNRLINGAYCLSCCEC